MTAALPPGCAFFALELPLTWFAGAVAVALTGLLIEAAARLPGSSPGDGGR